MDHPQQQLKIRRTAAAGMFYPHNRTVLKKTVEGLITPSQTVRVKYPRALIVPHAGYIYSGEVAGKGYGLLSGGFNEYTHVAVLGPPHYVYLDVIAASSVQEYQTPLGNVTVDHDRMTRLEAQLNSVIFSDYAHLKEHCIEVQLPFLQTVLGNFKLLPFLIGNLPPATVAEMIGVLSKFEDTLIVVSTDLSHYLSYEKAIKTDKITAERIESLDYNALADGCACGIWALRGLLKFAKEHQNPIHRIALTNSGDTSGNREQVVGYGAWALFDADD